MTQEDKELLLKDICARLSYEVVIHFDEKTNQDDERLYGMRENGGKFLINDAFYIEEVKPYLFPLSSMTEEQKKEFKEISKCECEIKDYGGYDSEGVYLIEIGKYEYEHDIDITVEQFYFNDEIIDWLNRNNFDYRGLIPMGLANDATGKNIY
jgi:hypothetical protein